MGARDDSRDRGLFVLRGRLFPGRESFRSVRRVDYKGVTRPAGLHQSSGKSEFKSFEPKLTPDPGPPIPDDPSARSVTTSKLFPETSDTTTTAPTETPIRRKTDDQAERVVSFGHLCANKRHIEIPCTLCQVIMTDTN
ncbi:hypothetical protein DPEC_G00333760 [Dallia pectoralis]|uniref:Uncharacterized protein n=1 Tax=Dallia pectoralis TaxID=75939 RepID=A0ACC2F6M3_DALPE|nr:hypothetical protein DPEC_G00333760 [Dallia pectoralis]